MTLDEKQFAEILDKADELHEASWDGDRYTKKWQQCCQEAGANESWSKIMAVLLFPGYCDVWDWTEEQRQ